MSPVFPNSIEVFDLAENQDMLSPVEVDPEKLAHKFKEVCVIMDFICIKITSVVLGVMGGDLCFYTVPPSLPAAPN